MLRTLWLTILVIVPTVLAFGTGPPTTQHPEICETMQPGHGTSTATGAVPFAIELNTVEYKKAETIQVTLYAKDASNFFRGFFIQARKADGLTSTVVGSFISQPEDGTQFIQCGTANSAWGHADRLKKTSVSSVWMGPSTDVGPLVFTATVVGHGKQEYWTGIMSSEVTFGSASDVKSHGILLSMMAMLAYMVHG